MARENPLIALLDRIDEAALNEIDRLLETAETEAALKIADAKTAYNTAVLEARRHVLFLQTARRLGAVKLGKEEPKKPRKKRAVAQAGATAPAQAPAPSKLDVDDSASLAAKRQEVAQYLSKGARPSMEIMRDLKIGPRHINVVLECNWFQKSAQGWHLTTLGRSQFFDD